jgi:hypothetical protein
LFGYREVRRNTKLGLNAVCYDLLLDHWQNPLQPASTGMGRAKRLTERRIQRKRTVQVVVGEKSNAHLPEVVPTLSSPRRLTRRLNRRQQQGHQDSDNANHYQ